MSTTERGGRVRALRVAVIGAGPAGIYAADTLLKADRPVEVDVFERLPAPFGLVRYGVAPDHPRIKQVVHALHRVLDQPGVRLFGNTGFGADLTLDDLRAHYDAVIVATGCERDRELDVPGVDLTGSHGAAAFVSWYDGHPDVPRTWELDAERVAVIGAGNVALDVASRSSQLKGGSGRRPGACIARRRSAGIPGCMSSFANAARCVPGRRQGPRFSCDGLLGCWPSTSTT